MNIIAIDPSKISTAMVINGKLFNYTTTINSHTKKGDWSKWYAILKPYMTYRLIDYTDYNTYEKEQLVKLNDFDLLSDLILKDILENIDSTQPTVVGMEGFAFSSENGMLIDLVAISTLIRFKIAKYVSQHLIIVSPSTLKQEACKMTYGVTNIGKKVIKEISVNKAGVSGGRFTKREMLLAILENDILLIHPYAEKLNSMKKELVNMNVPKPIDDINDAFLLYYYLLNKFQPKS